MHAASVSGRRGEAQDLLGVGSAGCREVGAAQGVQIAQGILLLLFIAMTIRAAMKFHPEVSGTAG